MVQSLFFSPQGYLQSRRKGEEGLRFRRMGRSFVCCFLILIHFGLALSSGLKTKEMDITTPITTIPTITPANPNPTTPATFNPATTTPPVSSGGSWCVASQSASQTALQVALDYACGYGGADCSAIQPDGNCYNPNTLRDHASYAFNSYYQKNPVPNSCNFGGHAVTTSTDPSNLLLSPSPSSFFPHLTTSTPLTGSGTCQYPSTSTVSSVLNTTNSSGATVFGSGPSIPSCAKSNLQKSSSHILPSTFLLMLLADIYT